MLQLTMQYRVSQFAREKLRLDLGNWEANSHNSEAKKQQSIRDPKQVQCFNQPALLYKFMHPLKSMVMTRTFLIYTSGTLWDRCMWIQIQLTHRIKRCKKHIKWSHAIAQSLLLLETLNWCFETKFRTRGRAERQVIMRSKGLPLWMSLIDIWITNYVFTKWILSDCFNLNI